MPRDYYDILELPRTANAEQVKKSYRRLAKKFHPDVNKSSNATAKFGEVQKAYEVLVNPEKRKLYDQYGHAGLEAGAGGAGGARHPFGADFSGFHTSQGQQGGFQSNQDAGDLSDLFDQFFSNPSHGQQRARRTGPSRRQRYTPPKRGQDLHHTITVPFDTAAKGGSIGIKLSGPDGAQNLDLKIPQGTIDGAKLRLKGKGHPSGNGGQSGDLIITVKVKKHPLFHRDGLDLFIDVPISIDEALFGTAVEIPTLDGRVTLTIPPGSGGGRKLRLRGAGIVDAQNKKGDLYAILQIDVPKELTTSQQKLLEKLKGKLPNPRENLKW